MFHSQYRVDFVDTDAGGVVYHTRYLEMAERARAAMLRELGLSNAALMVEDTIFPVAKMMCHFHKPAKLDDLIDVNTTITQTGGARLCVQQRLSTHDTLLVTLDLTLACANLAGKPKRLPSALADRFATMIRSPS